MRVFDALTYHAAVAQAQPDHYVCLLHIDFDGEPMPVLRLPDGNEHVVLHVKCMRPQDHEYNVDTVLRKYVNAVAVYTCEKNPYDGQVPCFRCKLY